MFLLIYLITISIWQSTATPLTSVEMSILDKVTNLIETREDLNQKLSDVNKLVILIDSNLKALQEKAHVWDLYRHHIDAWNDQMKSLDHKMDLIKYNQDGAKIIETKLTSMEFAVNQILSKVMLQDGSNIVKEVSKSCSNGKDNIKQNDDIIRLLKENKASQRDISNRLNTVLRHVLNIENSGFRSSGSNKSKNNQKHVGNLMKPITDMKQKDNDTTLRNIEGKLNELTDILKPKDIKQLISSDKKNSKTLTEILEISQNIAEITNQISSNEDITNETYMNCCLSTKHELLTFTDSSNLLLKRVEKLVLNVENKINHVINQNKSLTPSETKFTGINSEEVENTTPLSGENTISDEMNTSTSSNEEVDSSESAEPDYVQPSKLGCHDLTVRIDGVYKFGSTDLNKANRDFNERFCAFPTDGSGWTVVQRRGPYEHQENFNRSWIEYKNGFGSLAKDFWFGNEFIHRLTFNGSYELRIELDDFEDNQVWAQYSIFQVDSERNNYNLLIGGYRGAVTDSMLYHHMRDFSTYDKRNDNVIDECCPCAVGYGSGWWFDDCAEANLNGIYHFEPKGHNYIGVLWEHWHGDYSLKKTRMLMRPTFLPSIIESNEKNGKEYPDDP